MWEPELKPWLLLGDRLPRREAGGVVDGLGHCAPGVCARLPVRDDDPHGSTSHPEEGSVATDGEGDQQALPIPFKIYDGIHSQARLFLTVLPSR